MRDMAWAGMRALTCPSEEHAQNMNESHRRCGIEDLPQLEHVGGRMHLKTMLGLCTEDYEEGLGEDTRSPSID